MKDLPSAASPADGRPPFVNPLPGGHDVWKSSKLGSVPSWPEALQGFAQTVAAIRYPAALLWDKDYKLLHNKAWDDAGGIHAQGEPQRDHLPEDLLDALRYVAAEGIPKEIQSNKLFKDSATKTDRHASSVILSPLSTSSESCIMVQLLPKPMLYQSLPLKSGDGSAVIDHTAKTSDDSSTSTEDQKPVDKVPLDEHPFFRRFAEMLPSGLAILDSEAQAVFVNQHFYELTTTTTENVEFTSWPQSIHDDDYERVMTAYRQAFESQTQLRTEFRARGEPHPWRLLLLTPLGNENLEHVSLSKYGGFICSIVDISSEKSAELSERKAAKQARERKEQQERFIDMISHEIRNPLSAVLHCAEDIDEAIKPKAGDDVDVAMIREAVETIHLCVTHQKNIVDDVLSFSKLDASLLSLMPRPSQPSRQLQSTLKMFQHEFRKEHLEFSFDVDKAYDNVLSADWVLADIARISQVLINLITNAIKFTHHSKGSKRLNCSVAASVERPASYPPDVVFFSSEDIAYRMDATNTTEWGNGEALYVMVAVRDSGIGISEEGQKRLFERFQQATPKTEEVYGGSGLGLNISRKICHLHGGEIGVSSKEGEGSTFGFFFKVKRTGQPSQSAQGQQEESEGERQLRCKIEELGRQNPDDLDTAEPFPYRTPDESGKDDTVREQADRSDSKAAQSQNIAKPVPGKQESQDRYEKSKRPELSREHLTGEKSISADIIDPRPGASEPKRPVTSLNRIPSRRAHVLLVEDNIINQKIIFRKLEGKGFNVTTANNGKEAVEAMQQAPLPSSGDKKAFDVVLMDQEMPIMDGNAATRAIRDLEKKGQLERVPILGVTANARGAQQDEMVESGMDDVISKPYKIEALVETINKLTGVRQTA